MNKSGDPETLFAFLSESSFGMAEWVPLSSGWYQHVPIAFWLMEVHRPRCLVELGVHRGLSYMAFCQSAKAQGLDTRCFAIDTWKGDPHCSYYGEEVFQAVEDHNREHYGGFSTLIRSSFDEAVAQFPDASIDLLHIDGLHRYEAVRHDFETWLPKMSDRGLILFHDVSEHREDFGVFRLWEELKPRYPHFEFLHGHGLGILGVGTEQPDILQRLFAVASDGPLARKIRSAYARLGEGITRGTPADVRLRLERKLTNTQVALGELQERQNRVAGKLALENKRRRYLEKNAERLQFVVQSLQGRSLEYQAAMESLSQWQKSWFRRAFSRWRLRPDERPPGFLRRLEHSLRKRRKKILARLKGAAKCTTTTESGSNAPGGRARKITDEPIGEDPLKHAFRLHLEAELQAFLQSETRLELKGDGPPKVSVLVVLYNQAAFSLFCFQSLELEAEIPIELVVVDNGSTDQTGALLQRVDGASVLRNNRNEGFVKAVNQAAAQARGEHLLLLNNDAVMRPGCLSAALKTLESAGNIAAVGARLVLPDGSLQEAGSIVWADGHCLGYGRGLPMDAYQVMFRRDVDFCSAAFLLVKRGVFESVGGFDEDYSPAYSEETDFCLRLYEKGYRVVYEPGAVVDHFEFASTVRKAAVVAQQEKNIGLLLTKHRAGLARHWEGNPRHIVNARSRPPVRGRILIIDDFVPIPTLGSGCPRAREMLKILSEAGYFVTLWPREQENLDWDSIYRVLPREIEVQRGSSLEGLPAFLEERRGFYHSILASRPQNMEVLTTIKEHSPRLLDGVRIIYDAEALVALRDIQKATIAKRPVSPAEAEKRIGEELKLAGAADVVAVVSEGEATHFREAGIRNLIMVGHGLRVHSGGRSFRDRNGFLFVGRLSDEDSPNTDSILWFAREVLPLIKSELGNAVRVQIVGDCRDILPKMVTDPSLSFLGRVEDLGNFYAGSRVFIAPTRFAAGIPHKVHEAAAHGLPVVATTLLADQLQWTPGTELLAADDPEEFARNCIRLHEREELWTRLRREAMGRIEREQSPEQFSKSVLSLFEDS